MKKVVLDASALLAYLFAETGHATVAAVIDACCLSSVNLAEVLSRFARDGHNPELVHHQIAGSGIEIVPFLGEDAALAAGLVPLTQSFGLSLGDRACLALALRRNVTALTADRVWAELDLPIAIKVIRP
ncbi:MAG TPA: type II toxin-antitoxin system VapC family toxin [Xanthomonadales bacterium]|nr:type II toxin-antitoxin system VapC family toxin [Xanthomonadales bacterium]